MLYENVVLSFLNIGKKVAKMKFIHFNTKRNKYKYYRYAQTFPVQ